MTLKLHLPPDYVLDKMEFFEIRAILKHQHYAYKESWEQARLVAYLIAQTNSTKRLQITDIIKFPWEDEANENTAVSTIDKEALKERANEMAKLLSGETKIEVKIENG